MIIPKKLNQKQLEKFFIKKGLKNLIPLAKGIDKKKHLDRRRQNIIQEQSLSDLYNLYQFIVLNKRTTVLELGCGFSTLIMHLALKENEKKFGPKKPFERCKYPFYIFSVDNQKKYINIAKKRILKFSRSKPKVNFFYSKARMTIFNNNFAVEYENLPRVNPDFIYLDGPSQWGVKNSINNFTTAHEDMMPMSCDIIKFENFLTPGTIIVADGRTANSMFLKNNFKRNWSFIRSSQNDQCYLYLKEKPLGIHNQKQLKFYKKKIK
tara:strand:+ start:300 stop:1094 length:795 start_codon:yes stop_codon:yes gene_type:complete